MANASKVAPVGAPDSTAVARRPDLETPLLASLADVALPVNTLREGLPHLRRPFSAEAIKFKVQTVFKGASGCYVVAYIDARLVIERLNRVAGELWAPAYERVAGSDKLLVCGLTIDGVTRPDVGDTPKGLSKDLWSDALKRSAVQFGVGVSVYALPQIKLLAKDARGRIEMRETSKGPTIALTEHGHAKLREGYARWLREHGERLFGPVLDHGDVEGATFDPDEEAVDEAPPPALPKVDDEQGAALIARARDLYTQIAASPEGRKAFPPGQFNAWLEQRWHSHAALGEFVGYLEGRLSEAGGSREA